MQNSSTRQRCRAQLAPVLLLTLGVILLSVVALLTLPTISEAQVSITLSAQEMYDDNVFLEDGIDRPSFVIVDDQFENNFNDGEVPSVLVDETDGKEDSDFITNLSLSLAGRSPYFTNYMENQFQFAVGALLFAEYEKQNRLTLDGSLETAASDAWLPAPWYATLSNAVASSTSNDVSSAEGTATRTTQTYTLTGQLGVANVPLSRDLSWGLGYTGAYHIFLGELRFSSEEPGETEEEGSDYHTHTLGSSVAYQASKTVRVTLSGDAGVQYFTSVQTNDADAETRDADDLDRSNYNGRLSVDYIPNKSFSARSYVGVTSSTYMETPQPIDVTVIDENGDPQTVTIVRDDTETNLIFGGELAYSFFPGTSITLGVDQNSGTDIDGDRVTTRSVFSNGALAITDRLALNLGARFLEFSSNNDLDESTERWELTSSLNFLVTQHTSLILGYNFVDQDTDDPLSSGALLTRANDYQVNRVYIGVNVGFLGLPG